MNLVLLILGVILLVAGIVWLVRTVRAGVHTGISWLWLILGAIAGIVGLYLTVTYFPTVFGAV